ncbi:ABC transporter permease [Spongiimicrobium salis]|uniref:ABC transporter permease n=1 Tax=Spongiimicrobium salis TaxID=1667022 RepID=UPI00374D29A4
MSKNGFNRVNLFIAYQYLISRKKQSILATIGVLLGVSIFIVMISFMTGVNDFLDDAVFNGSPDIIVGTKAKASSKKGILGTRLAALENVDDILTRIGKDSNVQAFSRQLISPAILISETQQFPISINGVSPEREEKMVDLDRRLVQGQGFQSLQKKSSILLGVSLAERLQVGKGDTLTIILPNGARKALEVSGTFSFGITTVDNLRTYIHIETAQQLLNEPSLINHIHIKLKDRKDTQLKNKLLADWDNITVSDWKDSNKTIVIGNKVRNVLTWSISFALLLVAGFGIYNILNITVIQKRKDIAVLKTMGYTAKDIVFIFLVQSFLIGFTGAVLGILLGYGISYAISITPLETSDFLIADTYPVTFVPLFYVLGAVFGVLTALFAGYFPSRKASRVDPVTIIRGI